MHNLLVNLHLMSDVHKEHLFKTSFDYACRL